MKRVCLYVRVSTDKQTTENQIQALSDIAERSGYQIVRIYSDNGISGSKGREDRPALDQMMKEAVNRQFDMVMCWSIDRLGRSMNRYQYPRHLPTSLGTAFQILPEISHCCNYGV